MTTTELTTDLSAAEQAALSSVMAAVRGMPPDSQQRVLHVATNRVYELPYRCEYRIGAETGSIVVPALDEADARNAATWRVEAKHRGLGQAEILSVEFVPELEREVA